MLTDTQAPIEYTIEASSLDACKEILQRRFHTAYHIIDYKTVLKSRFFGLRHVLVTQAKYIIEDNAPQAMNQYAAMSQRSLASPMVPQVARTVPTSAAPPLQDSFTASRDNILKKQLGNADVTNFMQVAQIKEKLDEVLNRLDEQTAEKQGKEEHETIVKVDELLEQNEFTPSYISRMNERIRREFSLDDLDDFDTVQRTVVDWIGENIGIAEHIEPKPPHVIVIVGPTGVGKTTTIAKLASQILMAAKTKGQSRPVIHMITIDTMRVAAYEQIERYGEMMDIKIDKAESQDDLERLYKLYNTSKVDFVFIDTGGYSPNDRERIAKLGGILDVPGMHANTYLAVTASTKPRDLEKIMRNYEPFGYKSVIITKCDETSTYGNILSVLYEKGKKIWMITNGQEVLNKMERANPAYFLNYLDGFQFDRNRMKKRFGKNTAKSAEEK